MHRPTLVTPPATMPVSLEELKQALRVDSSDDDAFLGMLLASATDHLDGWNGVLGACIVEQTWQQDFDVFAREMALPLGPVISVTSVTWRNPAGQVATVPNTAYATRTDASGYTTIRFDDDYEFPTDLHESKAVAVTYKAGHTVVPDALKAAVILICRLHFDQHAAADMAAIRESVDSLIRPYRRVGV